MSQRQLEPQLQRQTVAVIVPLLNEIKELPTMLSALCRLGADELLVVDGGSTDGSREWLAEQAAGSITLISSAPGRGLQMNQGALHASSDVLLFLHADTVLPSDALKEVRHGRWGRFDIQFHDNVNPRSLLLSLIELMINLRSRVSGVATGDQAIFVERILFEEIGRFEAIPIMEDVSLSKRLRNVALPFCSRLKASTSARRWRQKGVWKTILLMWALRLGYVLGVSPIRLHKVYRQVR